MGVSSSGHIHLVSIILGERSERQRIAQRTTPPFFSFFGKTMNRLNKHAYIHISKRIQVPNNKHLNWGIIAALPRENQQIIFHIQNRESNTIPTPPLCKNSIRTSKPPNNRLLTRTTVQAPRHPPSPFSAYLASSSGRRLSVATLRCSSVIDLRDRDMRTR